MSNKLILICCSVVLLVGIAIWVAIFVFDGQLRANRRSNEMSIASSTAVTPTSASSAKASPTASVISREDAKGMVSLDYKWSKDGFGTIMMVDFVFTNKSPYPAKDLTVTCTHYAPSGTVIDSNTRTIYEIIPAKRTKKVNDFNMGFIHSQAASSICKIDDLVN